MSDPFPFAAHLAEVEAVLVSARRLHELAQRVHDETVVVTEMDRLDEELENL